MFTHNYISQINSTQTTLSINMDNNFPETIKNNRLLFYSRQMQEDDDDDEFSSHINIYHEHRGHLERDRKSRTQLDTEIFDLYDPVQETTKHNSTKQSIFSSTTSIPRSIETWFSFYRFMETLFISKQE
ncbi:38854_t:CDS:1 [Gigaspora margarita]|uniref:38854_t:CDS:1 n=1 Tax=Gigaspora margarita TaxID=4874 RepID=A0ABN7VKG5_GIGMA|nr:38854_t:CDS:1 [Gigaspora margarita]